MGVDRIVPGRLERDLADILGIAEPVRAGRGRRRWRLGADAGIAVPATAALVSAASVLIGRWPAPPMGASGVAIQRAGAAGPPPSRAAASRQMLRRRGRKSSGRRMTTAPAAPGRPHRSRRHRGAAKAGRRTPAGVPAGRHQAGTSSGTSLVPQPSLSPLLRLIHGKTRRPVRTLRARGRRSLGRASRGVPWRKPIVRNPPPWHRSPRHPRPNPDRRPKPRGSHRHRQPLPRRRARRAPTRGSGRPTHAQRPSAHAAQAATRKTSMR